MPCTRAALELAFDIGRMNRLAGVLEHGVAQNFRIAGIGVDLGVHHVGGKADAGAFRIDFDSGPQSDHR